MIECPNCKVAGWVLECHAHHTQFCEQCQDTDWHECPTCKGEGFVKESSLVPYNARVVTGFKGESSSSYNDRSTFLRCADCGVEAFMVWYNSLWKLNLCSTCAGHRWDSHRKQEYKEVKVNLYEWFHTKA